MVKGPFHYEDLLRVPFLVLDLAPRFLDYAGLDIPTRMTGKNQRRVWDGAENAVRDHVLREFHHQPTTMNLRTFINDRYKLTVYYRQTYGELFDLAGDPGGPATGGTMPAMRS